jgi:hypothetical protein
VVVQPSPYETPVTSQHPADYEAPVFQGTPEPSYAETGAGKNQVIYDRLDPALPGNHPTLNPAKDGASPQGKETTV